MENVLNDNVEVIDAIANDSDFTDKINEAVPYKVKLDVDLKREIKEIRDMYGRQMVKSDQAVADAYSKNKKKRTEEDWELINSFEKKLNGEFNALKKIIYPTSDGDSNRAAKSMVAKVVAVAKMLKYIGRTDIEDAFADAGFSLTVPNIEDENKYFDNDDVREVIKDVFVQVEDVQKQVKETSDKIKDEIYNSLPDSVRYDAAGNKKGIKTSQFQKLVKQKAIILEKGSEAAAKFKNKQISKTEEEIIAKQIEIEKAKQI